MAIIGGNCSLLGFDLEGNENFWTVSYLEVFTPVFRGCVKQMIPNTLKNFKCEDFGC